MRRTSLTFLLLAASLAAVGCSDDDSGAGTTASSGPVSAATDGTPVATRAPDESTPDTGTGTEPTDPGTPDGTLVQVTTTTLAPPPSVAVPEDIPTELVVTTLEPGTGEPAVQGDTVLMHYVGVRSEDGVRFDSNYGGAPLAVVLGDGQVFPGWEQGLVGARTGERRRIDVPARLAYGEEGRGELIRPNDALTLLVDVLAVVPGDPDAAVSEEDVPLLDAPVSEPVVEDVRAGTGAALEPGMTATFHFAVARADDGTIVESTWGTRQPQTIVVQETGTVPEFATHLIGMRVGGRRVLTLPSDPAAGFDPPTDIVVVADLLAAWTP